MYRVLFLGFCKKINFFFQKKLIEKNPSQHRFCSPRKKNKVNLKRRRKKHHKKKKSRGDILADKQDFFRKSRNRKIDKSRSSPSTLYAQILNYKNHFLKSACGAKIQVKPKKNQLGNWRAGNTLPFVIQGNNTRPKKNIQQDGELNGHFIQQINHHGQSCHRNDT